MADKLQISFKRGTQEALNNLTPIQEGVFYLTTDTNRLYVGRKDADNNIIADELNKTIRQVDSFTSLENKGATALTLNQFYYCIKENILAYCKQDGSTYKWVQVNPDTDTNDTIQVSKFEASDAIDNTEGKSIDINLTISQQKKNKDGNVYSDNANKIDDLKAIVKIPKSFIQGAIKVDGSAVELNAAEVNGGVQLNTAGVGAASHPVDIIGDKAVSVNFTKAAGSKNDTITITAPNYDATSVMTKDEGSITIKKDDQTLANLKLTPGEKISFTPDNESNTTSLKIDHVKIAAPTGTAAGGNPATVISGITTDNYGHITGYETSDLAQNPSLGKSYSLGDTKYDADSKTITVQLKEKDNAADTKALALTNLVSKKELEQEFTAKLAATDCMVYRGTIVQSDGEGGPGIQVGLPENPKNGDTYKCNVELFSQNGVIAKRGDLLIAVVPGNDNKPVSWNVIPSGDEKELTYRLDLPAESKVITLKSKDSEATTEEDEHASGSIEFQNGKKLTSTLSRTPNPAGDTIVVKYDHNTIDGLTVNTNPSTTDTSELFGTNSTITYLNDITVDDCGHITTATFKKTNFTKPNNIDVRLNSISNKDKTVSLKDADGNARGSIKINQDTNSNIVVKMDGSSTNATDMSNVSYTIGFEWEDF